MEAVLGLAVLFLTPLALGVILAGLDKDQYYEEDENDASDTGAEG